MESSRSWRELRQDPASVEALIEEAGGVTAAARELGIAHSTLSAWRSRQQADEAAIDAQEIGQLGRVMNTEADARVLREHGYDPSTHVITSRSLNRETGAERITVKPIHMLPKSHLATALALAKADGLLDDVSADMLPTRSRQSGPTQAVARRQPAPAMVHAPGSGSRLVAFLGCQHAPHHHRDLDRLARAALAHMQPDDIVALGDGGDYPTVGNWATDPHEAATLDECTQGERDVLEGYAAAAPDAQLWWMAGNHGSRLAAHERRAPGLAGARRATRDGRNRKRALDLAHLIGLDEMGAHVVEGRGADHRHAVLSLVPGVLNATHGVESKGKSGEAVQSAVRRKGVGQIQADTHKQAICWVTMVDDGTGHRTDLLAMEVGMMADPELVPWAAPDAAWQLGFGTVEIAEDGSIAADLASFRSGVLTWRGLRWWIGDDGEVHTTAPAR